MLKLYKFVFLVAIVLFLLVLGSLHFIRRVQDVERIEASFGVNGQIFLDGGGFSHFPLSDSSIKCTDFKWSPNGYKLAASCFGPNARSSLYFFDLRHKDEGLVLSHEFYRYLVGFSWAPDSNSVALELATNGGVQIYTTKIGPRNQVEKLVFIGNGFRTQWSEDGDWLLYYDSPMYTYVSLVFMAPSSGGDETFVDVGRSPVWFNGGIAYIQDVGDSSFVVLSNVDGSDKVIISESRADTNSYLVEYDDKSLVYISFNWRIKLTKTVGIDDTNIGRSYDGGQLACIYTPESGVDNELLCQELFKYLVREPSRVSDGYLYYARFTHSTRSFGLYRIDMTNGTQEYLGDKVSKTAMQP